MTQVSFLNGQFVNHDEAFLHIDDRAIQFADGIYEVILFYNNKLIDIDLHLERLFYGLDELGIKFNYDKKELIDNIYNLFPQNNLKSGSVYLQVTRGAAKRIQNYPASNVRPTIIMTVSPLKREITLKEMAEDFNAKIFEDIRWKRCDIKSTSLLANTMLKEKASQQNYSEAILHRDNQITEGSFSNVFMVKNNVLITRPASNLILNGITRKRLLSLADNNKIKITEKIFTIDELLKADELFVTSSTLLIRPITQVNDQNIGDGKIGKITKKMVEIYFNFLNY